MQLAELEQAFWSAVRTRGAPPPGLATWLTGSAKQTPVERLTVYHRAYWGRQVTALTATFPRLSALLGAAHCERLMLAYVEAQPGVEPCIERLGAGFVEFIAARADVAAEPLGVARLEWAATESLLACDSESVTALPRDLGPDFVDCRLTFVPSLRVEHVPAGALAAFAGEQPPVGQQDDGRAERVMLDVAFCRPRFAVLRHMLEPDEARAQALARGGAKIALICSAFAELAPELAAPRALQVLRRWFERGWVAGWHL